MAAQAAMVASAALAAKVAHIGHNPGTLTVVEQVENRRGGSQFSWL
jgi:hypothetical protein